MITRHLAAITLMSVIVTIMAADAATAGDHRCVGVSILPLAYVVDRISDGQIDVEVLVGPGQSPATYEPLPRQLTRLADCRLLFAAGVPFEKSLVPRLQSMFSDLNVIDVQNGLRLLPNFPVISDEHHGDNHHHGEHDPHTWLDPLLLAAQAGKVCDGLCAFDAQHAAEYRQNLADLDREMQALHLEIREILEPIKGRKLYVFHAAFGYFARAYGLKQVPIEVEGKEPGLQHLAGLIREARSDSCRAIFVQQQFATASAEAVAEAIGADVIVLDPLAYDYPENLRTTARRIVEAVR